MNYVNFESNANSTHICKYINPNLLYRPEIGYMFTIFELKKKNLFSSQSKMQKNLYFHLKIIQSKRILLGITISAINKYRIFNKKFISF